MVNQTKPHQQTS